jgi:hypothetical protein
VNDANDTPLRFGACVRFTINQSREEFSMRITSGVPCSAIYNGLSTLHDIINTFMTVVSSFGIHSKDRERDITKLSKRPAANEIR